jgi:hypothetical protein
VADLIGFLAIALVPLLIFFINSGVVHRERRGIAAGIPRPKRAKEAKPPSTPRPARVRPRRVADCGRGFTHLALSLVGSRNACRYCSYLQELPSEPSPSPDESDTDGEAAVKAAQEILDQSRQ